MRPRPLARASEGKGLMRGARLLEDALDRGLDTFWDHSEERIASQVARLERARRFITRRESKK